MPQLPLPQHLAHQPVFAVPYFDHDGLRSGDTDAQWLSIGWAQYDPHQISSKIWRHSEQRWSRQSEELPLDRLVDLAAFLAICVRDHERGELRLPTDFLENQAGEILAPSLQHGPAKTEAFSRALAGDECLRRRLGKLADVLIDMRQNALV